METEREVGLKDLAESARAAFYRKTKIVQAYKLLTLSGETKKKAYRVIAKKIGVTADWVRKIVQRVNN